MDDRTDAGSAETSYTPNRRPYQDQNASPAQRPFVEAASSSSEEEGEISAPGPSTSKTFANARAQSPAAAQSSSDAGNLRNRIARGRWATAENDVAADRYSRPTFDRDSRQPSGTWSDRGSSASSASGYPVSSDPYARDSRAPHGRWRDSRAAPYPPRGGPRSPYDAPGPASGSYRRSDWNAPAWPSASREAIRSEEDSRYRSASTSGSLYGSGSDRYGSRYGSARDWRDSRADRYRETERERGEERLISPPRSDRGSLSRSDRASSDVAMGARRRDSRQESSSPVEQRRIEDTSPNTASAGRPEQQLSSPSHNRKKGNDEDVQAWPDMAVSQSVQVLHNQHSAAEIESKRETLGHHAPSDAPVTKVKGNLALDSADAATGDGPGQETPFGSSEGVNASDRVEELAIEKTAEINTVRLPISIPEIQPQIGEGSVKDVEMSAGPNVQDDAEKDLGKTEEPVDERIDQDFKDPAAMSSKEETEIAPVKDPSLIALSTSNANLSTSSDRDLTKIKSEKVSIEGDEASPALEDGKEKVLTAGIEEISAKDSSLSTLTAAPELSVKSSLAGDEKTRRDEEETQDGLVEDDDDSKDEDSKGSQEPALEPADRLSVAAVSKRPSSRGSTSSQDKSSTPNVRRMIACLIAKNKIDVKSGVDASKIAAQNRFIAMQGTAMERRPAFQDHSLSKRIGPSAEQMKSRIASVIVHNRTQSRKKINLLRERYRCFYRNWKSHCSRLERAQEFRDAQKNRPPLNASVSTPGVSGMMASQSNASANPAAVEDASLGLLSNASMSRGNRRNTQSTGLAAFGDAVRSEAEFLEILASLENADMQDPSARAARTTAVEPDMIIVPSDERAKRAYDDDNGFIANPEAFYFDDFDPDFWSEEERIIFDKRYALYPKQFGKIASALPNKTPSQCVNYYYLTKKDPGHDYKALLASKGRDRRRKTRVKPRKGRGSALMADLKADEAEEEANTPQDELPPRRAAGRSRMLSGLITNDNDTIFEEGGASEAPTGRKRRADDSGLDDGKAARGRAPRRAKTDKKAKALGEDFGTSTDSTMSEMAPVSQEQGVPGDLSSLAAASQFGKETVASKRKKGSKVSASAVQAVALAGEAGQEEVVKKSRQSTSSYWSVVERTEFLRSLAVYGKEWDSIAQNLTTKSAAQARNFFMRNSEESDLVEAMSLADKNKDLPEEERMASADDFVQRRAKVAQSAIADAREGLTAGRGPGNDADEMVDESDPPVQTKHGLNISSLLNDVADDRRKPAQRKWFGGSEGSDDDTEDEEGPPRVHSAAAAAAFRPPERRSVAEQESQPSYRRDEFQHMTHEHPSARVHSSVPPMSTFMQTDYRTQQAGSPYPPSFGPTGTRERLHFTSARDDYQMPSFREPEVYPGSLYGRSPSSAPSRPGPASVTMRDGVDGSWSRSHPSRPSPGYPGMHLAPPSSGSGHFAPSAWHRADQHQAFSRPSSSPSASRLPPSPSVYPSQPQPYERHNSTGEMNGGHAAARSLSPLPFHGSPPHAHAYLGSDGGPRPPLYPPEQLRRYDAAGRSPHGGASR